MPAFGLLWRRGVAALLDLLAVAILTVILALLSAMLLGLADAGEAALRNAGWVAVVVAWWLYFAPLEAGKGTIGKTAFRLSVMAASGGRVGLARATWRQVAKAVLWWLAPLSAFRADGRALHDLVSGTRLERAPRPAA